MKYFFVVFLIFLLIFTVPCFAEENRSSYPDTVLGIYMIGGNLEYDTGLSPEENSVRRECASKDIKEMISGWGEGNPDLGLVVAYGGAQKEGWDGMTIAPVQDLITDNEDGIIGNSGTKGGKKELVNMGSSEGLGSFLSYLNSTYPDSRVILILWDHGSSYLGYGRDENYGGSLLSLGNLQESFQKSGIPIEVIGFDACYMADLEVAYVLSPYARYMIASEEAEPDHGWDYKSVVSTLVRDPGIDAESFGNLVISSYMENPDHQKGSLSLSLLDLSKTKDVIAGLDTFSQKFDEILQNNGYMPVSQVVGHLNGIGMSKDEQSRDLEYMVDLKALSDFAGDENPEMKEDADRLKDALSSFILDAQQDTPLQQLSGVGIFSPIMSTYPELQSGLSEGTVLAITPEWISFLSSLKKNIESDVTAPEISVSGNGYQVSDVGYTLVTYVYYQNRDDGSRVVLAQEPAYPDESGIYPAPEWNGAGTYLSDGKESSLLPVYYVDSNEDGVQLYYAWGTLQQDSKKSLARMDIWYDPETTTLHWSVNPYVIRDGKQEFDRSSGKMYPGDVFSAYTIVLDPSGVMGWEPVGTVTWNDTMKITHQMMPCGEYSLQILASDLNGNSGESDSIPYPISCDTSMIEEK